VHALFDASWVSGRGVEAPGDIDAALQGLDLTGSSVQSRRRGSSI
jgi:hypothetical protein